jgi:hypothetical protein
MQLRSILSITVLGVVFATGCARKPDDAALVTNIKAQMFSDAQLKGANLQVTAKNGQVTLTGTVPNDAARLDAHKIATQTAGVSKVNDQMTVENAQTADAGSPQASEAAQPGETPQPAEAAQSQSEEAQATPAPSAEAKRVKREHRRDKHATRQDREVTPAKTYVSDTFAVRQQPAAPQVSAQAPSLPATDSNPPPVTAPVPAPPPPPPVQVQVPAGTTMEIRMIDGIDSSVNQPGEIFHASLDAPIVVGNQVVVPKDADVYVRLASVSSAGHIKGRSELELQLVKLEFQGQSYPLTSSTYTVSGASRGKNTAKKVGGGAILGTLIGAIAGGGKGAAIGAAVGAGAGGAYQEATRGKQVKVPSETKLDFQLEQPVSVMVMPQPASSDQ